MLATMSKLKWAPESSNLYSEIWYGFNDTIWRRVRFSQFNW